MSHKLRRQIDIERQQLRRLLETHRPLLEKCGSTFPDTVELSALAALLHSFYTGVENILKRIAIEIDGGLPSSEFWHRQLVDRMADSNPQRPSVLSAELRGRLRGYLDFRHVFRHAYVFELRWKKMAELVLGLEATHSLFDLQLAGFQRFLDSEQGPDNRDSPHKSSMDNGEDGVSL